MNRTRLFEKLKYILLVVFISSNIYPAAGISTPFGAVEVNNLKIGMEYSLAQLGKPIRASAWGFDAADMVFTLRIPNPSELRKGFEPIPDISWIKVERERIPITPGEEVSTDLIIKIPNDEKYFGKKYQAILNISAEPKVVGKEGAVVMGIAPAYDAPVYITIAESPATIEEIRRMRELLRTGQIKFEVIPMRIYLDNIKVGKKINVKKEYKADIKIINHGERDLELAILSVDPKTHGAVREGVFDYGEKNWLLFPKNKIKLEKDTIKRINFFINLPNKDEYKGKKYVLLARIETVGEIVKLGYSVHIYINTAQ